jgi:hypothetical protein
VKIALYALASWIAATTVALAVGGAVAQTPCQTGPKDPAGVYVNLDDTRNTETIRHVRAAVARGEARVLHWDPAGADARRDASLRGFPIWSRLPLDQRKAIDPAHFDLTHDRDEYPPAASREGGAGADVEYILSGDNRSAGTRMENQMSVYCTDTRFVVEP